MTVQYANVTENVLYEKWKNTEDLDLFKKESKCTMQRKIEFSKSVQVALCSLIM